MPVKKIGLCSITVSDAKKATKFFTDILGLKIKDSSPEHGWYELVGKEGGSLLGVGQSDDKSKAGMNAIVAMEVEDLKKTKVDLESKGVKFLSEIIEMPNVSRLVLFTDLDGNIFYLTENLRKNSQK